MIFLLLGAGIGLVAGVSPGPVLALVITETARGGWPRGAAVATGPLLADGPIVLLALLVFARLPPAVVPAISLAGGVFLLYLAGTTLLASRHARPAARGQLPAQGGFARGLLVRGLSPNPYLFWFLVGAPLLVEASRQGRAAAIALLVGYYVTIVGSNVAIAFVLSHWIGLLSERVYRALLALGGLVMVAYGATLVGQGATSLRNR